MSKREEILEDKVHIAGGRFTENLSAPNGVASALEIEVLRDELLNMTIGYLASELVDVKKNYPKNDTMDVEMSTDLVVMRRKDFDELMLLDTEVNE